MPTASRHSGRRAPRRASPKPWGVDKTVPGAFVWLLRAAGVSTTPAVVVGRGHPGWAAAPLRDRRRAGVDWVVKDPVESESDRRRRARLMGVVTGPQRTEVIPFSGGPGDADARGRPGCRARRFARAGPRR